MLYTRARAFLLLFEASTAAEAAPHTIPYGLPSTQRMTSVVGNKIGHRSPALRDFAAYAPCQAAPMSRGQLLPFPSMLRLVSVSCLVTAGLSTVLPVSAALLACAAMAEVLKANGAADWPA